MTRRKFFFFILVFFVLWTIAWLKHNLLVSIGWWSANNHTPELIYWASAKFLIWVIYPWLFWRKDIPKMRDFLGLSPTTLRRGYRWGGVAGVLWLGLSLLVALTVQGRHIIGVSVWSTFIYATILTPIFEEIFFRGFIISGLQMLQVEGKRANLMTTTLFLLIHILGWGFQRMLLSNLVSGAWLGIALVSLMAGFLRIHAKSLRASIVLHVVNNSISGVLG